MKNTKQSIFRCLMGGADIKCIAALTLLFCSACSMAPEYKRVDMAGFLPDFFVNEDDSKHDADFHMSYWWRQFNDPTLNSMIGEMLKNNLELEVATARIAQAREQITVNTGVLYPEVSLNGSAARTLTPTQTIASGALSGLGPDRIYQSQFAANVGVAWQMDIFGRLKSQARASEAALLSADLDREKVKHTLIAELVNRYITIGALNQQIELQRQAIEARSHSLSSTERRYSNGAKDISATDLHNAKELLSTSEANLAELQRAVKEQYYAMTILMGRAPNKEAKYTQFALGEFPDTLPKVIPASLIDRRPDLRSSEFRMIAANENIGVAIADLYPDITLSADIGYRSDELKTLFKPEQVAGSVLAQMSQTLFGGGRLRAFVRQNEANLDELAADYKQTILEALGEVETALMAEEELNKQLEQAEKAELHAAQAYYNAENRYKTGLLEMAQLLDAKQRYLNVSLQKTNIEQARWQNRVQLYLALGGDWFDAPIANNTSEKEQGNARL